MGGWADLPMGVIRGQGWGGTPGGGPKGAKAQRQRPGSASGRSGWGLGREGASEEPRAPAVGTQGPRPHLQVDMLYEEALYTVLHRAGTMGPDQVDDEEALLSYLQQVSPRPRPLGWLGPTVSGGG